MSAAVTDEPRWAFGHTIVMVMAAAWLINVPWRAHPPGATLIVQTSVVNLTKVRKLERPSLDSLKSTSCSVLMNHTPAKRSKSTWANQPGTRALDDGRCILTGDLL